MTWLCFSPLAHREQRYVHVMVAEEQEGSFRLSCVCCLITQNLAVAKHELLYIFPGEAPRSYGKEWFSWRMACSWKHESHIGSEISEFSVLVSRRCSQTQEGKLDHRFLPLICHLKKK